MHFIVLLLACVCVIFATKFDIQCRNENGTAVEWFVIYKFPKLHPNDTGLDFVYIDAEQTQWKKSQLQIDDENSPVGRTLLPMYAKDKPENMFHVSYNDEWPNKHKSFTRGHSKGVFIGDLNRGFWLIHSVPRYPPWSNTSYGYPHSGRLFGQSFLCISLMPSQFDIIGAQWLYNYPYAYDYNAPKQFTEKFPNLYAAAISHHVKKQPWYKIAKVNASSGTNFYVFSKAGKFGRDLYDSLVSPFLNVDLWAETWQNGVDYLGPYCGPKHFVKNIKQIQILNVRFNSTHDHSKWAVAYDAVKSWICIGDINRMTSQFHRGGGTVCMKNLAVWKAYKDLVAKTDQCRSNSVIML